jgi:UPF0755 protein
VSRSLNSLRRFLALVAILVLLTIVVAAGVGGYWYLGPYKAFGAETFVEIEHGMSSRAIAEELARQGVVRSRWPFLFVRLLHPTATLQAGEYRFVTAETPWSVFEKIRRGEIFYEDFTVPEGSNIFDIAGMLKGLDIIDPDEFLRAAADPEMIRDLDPRTPNLEGYLFPSTYRVTHHTTAKQLCRAMTAEFRKEYKLLGGQPNSPDTHKLVTLASMVEKETGLAQERPLVAAVFFNRLRLDMPLQCDPTTVYAALLQNRYRGVIHRSDLANTSPYNTYTHIGLPPGPICNAGLASLKAVIHPAAADYLYFVAKPNGSGSHHFSSTLDAHMKAVLAYRNQSR